MFQGPIEDRLAIRERYGAYSDAAFQSDMDAWLANWSEDCVWAVFGTELRGKPALRAQWETLWNTMTRMGFFAEIGAIDVDGDRATARCYCREIFVAREGGIRKIVGQYDDDLVRENGVWLFAQRRYTVLIDEAAPPA